MKKRTLVLLAVLLAAGCVAAYWNAPRGNFVWDDINLIVYDYQIRDVSFVKDIFTRDFFGFQDNARKYGYYRPIITLTYMLDYKIWGLNPAGYHVTNIATHVVATIFFFLILLRLFDRKPLGPFLASLLFAVHPIHTESVTWIAGRTDTICGMFFFISLWAYLIWAERFASRKGIRIEGSASVGEAASAGPVRSGRNYLIFSLVMFLFAILSKEMAVIMPGVLLVYLVLYHTGFSLRKLPPFLWSLLVYLAIIGGYTLFRLYVIEFSTQAKDPWGVTTTLISFVWTITYYLMKMAWPLHLSGYIQNELVTSVLSLKVLVSFAILGLIAWAIWASYAYDRVLCFGLTFLSITFAPLSNFIRISGPKDMGFMTAERFLYIPSAAFFLVIGLLLSRLIGRVGSVAADHEWGKRRRAAVALSLSAVLVGSYTFLSVERNKIWRTNEVFFNDCLAKAPNAPLLYMMLGNIHSLSGKWDLAEKNLKLAIEYLSPRDREEPTWIYSDLAGVYAKQGEYDKALEMMKLASRGRMHNSAVEFNMGEIYRMMGDLEKSVDYYKRSLGVDRKNIKALEQLGLVLQQLEQWDESNKWYVALSKLLPNNARIYANIGRNYMMLRDYSRAISALEQSLKTSESAGAYDLLGNAYISMNKVERGIEYIKKAVETEPKDGSYRASLGNALFAMGQKQEAHKELLEALKLDPGNVKALLGMGILASDQNYPDIARKTFLRVLEIDPANVKAMLSLGILEYKEHKNSQAAEWFKKALETEKGNKVALSYLGKMGISPDSEKGKGG